MVQWFLRKASFNFHRKRSSNCHYVYLQYSHIFITLISCLHLLRLQKLLKNPLFPIEQFDLTVKAAKVNPGLSLEQTMTGPCPRCYIPSFVEIDSLVPEEIFCMFFTTYGCGGHLGHDTQVSRTKFLPLIHRGSTRNLTDWPSGFREDV